MCVLVRGVRCKGLMDPRLILAVGRTMGTPHLKFSLITASSSIIMVQHGLKDPIKCVTITLVKVIGVPRGLYLAKRK